MHKTKKSDTKNTGSPVKTQKWMSTVNVNQDPASGVTILLSQRFSSRILTQGAVGSRIVWVRLEGPVCPLFVVCAYIPHKYRKSPPRAADTIHALNNLLSICKDLKSADWLCHRHGRLQL